MLPVVPGKRLTAFSVGMQLRTLQGGAFATLGPEPPRLIFHKIDRKLFLW